MECVLNQKIESRSNPSTCIISAVCRKHSRYVSHKALSLWRRKVRELMKDEIIQESSHEQGNQATDPIGVFYLSNQLSNFLKN